MDCSRESLNSARFSYRRLVVRGGIRPSYRIPPSPACKFERCASQHGVRVYGVFSCESSRTSALAQSPFPLVIGSGKRLFSEGTIPSGLKLVDSKVSTTGVVIGTYEPAGELVTGTFAPD